MADQRGGGIAWTDETWNPVRGCSRISPGCLNCYAEEQALRIRRFDRARGVRIGQGAYDGLVTMVGGKQCEQCEGTGFLSPDGRTWCTVCLGHGRVGGEARWTGVVRSASGKLVEPLHWRKPRRVFVNSMSDLFHENLDDLDIDQVFAVMLLATRHTFQVLTKRAERLRAYMSHPDVLERIEPFVMELACQHSDPLARRSDDLLATTPADLYVRKNRGGRKGVCRVRFSGGVALFQALAQEEA